MKIKDSRWLERTFVDAQKAFKRQQPCLLSNCDLCQEPSIQSHSISKSALHLLTEDQHVASFENDIYSSMVGASAKVQKVGIGRASVFPGFCAEHDNKLFKALDTSPVFPTQSLARSLFIRCVGHEVRAKTGAAFCLSKVRPFLEISQSQFDVSSYIHSLEVGAEDHRAQMISCFTANAAESRWKYVQFVIPQFLPFAFAAPLNFDVFPSYNPARINWEQTYPSMALSLAPGTQHSILLISWTGPLTTGMRAFLERIRIASGAISELILQFALEHVENLYFKPSWLDSVVGGTAYEQKVRDLLDQNTTPHGNSFINRRPLKGMLPECQLNKVIFRTNSSAAKRVFRGMRG